MSLLRIFSATQRLLEERKLLTGSRLVGYVISADFDAFTVSTCTALQNAAGPLSRGGFALAMAESSPDTAILLRVQGTARSPLSGMEDMTNYEMGKRGLPELDRMTSTGMSWSCLRCDVLGCFYEKDTRICFGGDLCSLAAAMLEYNMSAPCLGQLIIDTNGEYAHDNPQDGRCLRSRYPSACVVYSVNATPGGPDKLLRFNFYQTPVAAMSIFKGRIAENGSTYVNAFLAAALLSLDLCSPEEGLHYSVPTHGYIQHDIDGRPLTAEHHYGERILLGDRVFVSLPADRRLVLSIPSVAVGNLPDRPTDGDLICLREILSILPALVTPVFDNALFPITRCNSLVSIAQKPCGKMLELLSRDLLKSEKSA